MCEANDAISIQDIKRLEKKLIKNQVKFFQNIEKFEWQISSCMQALNLCRKTYYDWIDRYPAFKTVAAYYKQKYHDDLLENELKLKARIKKNSMSALDMLMAKANKKLLNDETPDKNEVTALIFANKTLNDMTEKVKQEHSGNMNNTQTVIFKTKADG